MKAAVAAPPSWQRENQRSLGQAVTEVLGRLGSPSPAAAPEIAATTGPADHSALHRLLQTFSLNRFERDVVVLCVGYEVDERFAQFGHPTVGLALRAFDSSHWSAFEPDAALRRWGLVAIGPGSPLIQASISVAKDVLSFLMGFPPSSPWPATRNIGAPVSVPPSTVATAASLAQRLAGTAGATRDGPVVELSGADPIERQLTGRLCAEAAGVSVQWLDPRTLSADQDHERSVAHWNRYHRLTGTILGVELFDGDDEADDVVGRVLSFIEGIVFISRQAPEARLGDALGVRLVRHEVAWPSVDERLGAWRAGLHRALDDSGASWPADLDRALPALAHQYRIGSGAIDTVIADIGADPDTAHGRDGTAATVLAAVQRACRQRSRVRLDPVAQRVPSRPGTPVILPARATQDLDDLTTHIRYAYQVDEAWGLRDSSHGGVTALFAGPSGTGKTHAARAVADRVGFDLYRVDLATVLSKYIGETEKMLNRIFDASDAGGVILLFDEADALFGKRSDVKDSHDRYANLGTAYLLQRMEQVWAPIILTTNIRDGLDPAFSRRLRFVVEFPFPDRAARADIWRSHLPPTLPTLGVDPDRLAGLAINGATIRDVLRRAAFQAAETARAVTVDDICEAARRELTKNGRDLTSAERSLFS